MLKCNELMHADTKRELFKLLKRVKLLNVGR